MVVNLKYCWFQVVTIDRERLIGEKQQSESYRREASEGSNAIERYI